MNKISSCTFHMCTLHPCVVPYGWLDPTFWCNPDCRLGTHVIFSLQAGVNVFWLQLGPWAWLQPVALHLNCHNLELLPL